MAYSPSSLCSRLVPANRLYQLEAFFENRLEYRGRGKEGEWRRREKKSREERRKEEGMTRTGGKGETD